MMSSLAKSSVPKFRYLSAWFCPFAHRATLALEHHAGAGRVEYEWVEALGWQQEEDKKNVTGTGKQWIYHWKSEELVRVNPSALVPTLIPIKEDGEADEERAVFESLVTMEYIDEVSGAQGKDRLVAEDPFLAARSRIWADKVNRDCCSPYYGVLVRKDKEEQRDHFEKLVQGLTKFSTQLEATSGDLFLPDNQLSIVDLALLPWACRFYVFEKYRGEDFKIPQDPALDAYHRWYEHVTSMDSVKRTLPPKDDYLEHIGKYADGSARSKVANAVRRGVSAHEFDDDVDDYQGSEKDV